MGKLEPERMHYEGTIGLMGYSIPKANQEPHGLYKFSNLSNKEPTVNMPALRVRSYKSSKVIFQNGYKKPVSSHDQKLSLFNSE